VGGLALGAAVASSYPFAYPPYAYAPPYPYAYAPRYPYAYAPPVYAAPRAATYPPPPVVYSPPPSVSSSPPVAPTPPGPAVQREVVFPNGKYVLRGDGVAQPWQWLWVPSAPATAPPPGPQTAPPPRARPDDIQAPGWQAPRPPSADPRT